MIFGFISSYQLPNLFIDKISKFFYQQQKNNKKDGCQSEFYKAKDQREIKSYL